MPSKDLTLMIAFFAGYAIPTVPRVIYIFGSNRKAGSPVPWVALGIVSGVLVEHIVEKIFY